MSEYTKYPNQIDTTAELPKVTDLVTPVKAEVVNRLRDAVLAVENELGIQPSGTFSTVRARFDHLDSLISSISNNIDSIELSISSLEGRVETLENSGGGGGGGGGTGDVFASKTRVYVGTSNFSGAAADGYQLITWNASSILIDSVRATVSATAISPTVAGHFLVSGQLTIVPTIDNVSSILIEILLNNSPIIEIEDSGAVWGVGIERSLPFNVHLDLAADDELSVRWTHRGAALSETELVFGDSKTWFSFSRISGLE